MRSIDELLQAVAEGDEEAQKELRERYLTAEQEKARVARDLKLKTDSRLKELYPRALRAYNLGKLNLAEDLDDEALVKALKEQEEFYADMGVPIESPPATPSEQAANTDTGTEGEEVPVKPAEDDPAKALVSDRSTQSPGGQPRDYVHEFFTHMSGSTAKDQQNAFAVIAEINKMKDKVRADQMLEQISDRLSAEPIRVSPF